MWTQCVIDALFEPIDGAFTFTPIEGDLDGEFFEVSGISFISKKPPEWMKLVGIVHMDGQEAVERYRARWKAELEDVKKFGPEAQDVF